MTSHYAGWGNVGQMGQCIYSISVSQLNYSVQRLLSMLWIQTNSFFCHLTKCDSFKLFQKFARNLHCKIKHQWATGLGIWRPVQHCGTQMRSMTSGTTEVAGRDRREVKQQHPRKMACRYFHILFCRSRIYFERWQFRFKVSVCYDNAWPTSVHLYTVGRQVCNLSWCSSRSCVGMF